MIATCKCQHCEGGLEFETDDLTPENAKITCPHCGCETPLHRHSDEASKKKIAEYKAGVPARLAKYEADIKEIEGYLRNQKIVSHGDDLELSGDSVIIRKRGVANMLASGLNGERMIAISTLTGIQLKLGTWISPGYILFSYAGSKPFMGGIFAATEDPDAFIFEKELNDNVSRFRATVLKLMQESRQPQQVSNGSSLADELRKLSELKEKGILSDQEFESAKRKLLN
jgi:hypothetical protein